MPQVKTTYKDKLKDPRWQKRRLEILQRDDFKCRSCGDSDSTLHVHHRAYIKGDPWEVPDSYLVALCESCHETESNDYPAVMEKLRNVWQLSGGMIDDLIRAVVAPIYGASKRVERGSRPLDSRNMVVMSWMLDNFVRSAQRDGEFYRQMCDKFDEGERAKREAERQL